MSQHVHVDLYMSPCLKPSLLTFIVFHLFMSGNHPSCRIIGTIIGLSYNGHQLTYIKNVVNLSIVSVG